MQTERLAPAVTTPPPKSRQVHVYGLAFMVAMVVFACIVRSGIVPTRAVYECALIPLLPLARFGAGRARASMLRA